MSASFTGGVEQRGEVRGPATRFVTALPATVALSLQCWSFVIGSALFAAGTAPGFASSVGAGAANVLCFIGSWFFTGAAWIQLMCSAPEGSVE